MAKLTDTDALNCTIHGASLSGKEQGDAVYISICEDRFTTSSLEIVSEGPDQTVLARYTLNISRSGSADEPDAIGLPTRTFDPRPSPIGLDIFFGAVCRAAGVSCDLSRIENIVGLVLASAIALIPLGVSRGRPEPIVISLSAVMLLFGLAAAYFLVGTGLWWVVWYGILLAALAMAGVIIKIRSAT